MKSKEIKLHHNNIQVWKDELDRIAEPYMGKGRRLSTTISDKQWLQTYQGQTPQEAYDDEIFYSSQN